MAIEDESLLNILQAHGQQFLDSFSVPENEKKRKRSSRSVPVAKLAKCETGTSTRSSDSAEEWSGFGSGTHTEDEGWESPSPAEEVTPIEGVHAFLNDKWKISASRWTVLTASTSVQRPDVVVFSGFATKLSEASVTKAQSRAFMVCSCPTFVLLQYYLIPLQVLQGIPAKRSATRT